MLWPIRSLADILDHIASLQREQLTKQPSENQHHAGDWLTTVPSPSLGLLLKPQEFIAALRYRLGHPAPLVVNQVIVLAITPSTALGMVSELLDTIG